MSRVFASGMSAVALAAAAGLLASASAASAGTVTFQNLQSNAFVSNYTGTQSAWIAGNDGDYNGSYVAMLANEGRGGGADIDRGLLKFDLSSLAGQIGPVTSATLTLTQIVNEASSPNPFTFSLYRITNADANWQEGGGGEQVAGTVTWNNLSYSSTSPTPWAGSAGLSTSTNDPTDAHADYVGTAVAQGTYNDAAGQNGAAVTLSLPASLIQDWITGPNAGLLIKTDNASASQWAEFAGAKYTGSNGGDSTWDPILTINYSAVPEPVSGSLLLIGGGLLALRRRRRS